MYRWRNGLLPITLTNLFEASRELHNYNTKNAEGPHRGRIKINIINKSFLVESPKLWLTLPNDIETSNNI